jgi:hypothetical protein
MMIEMHFILCMSKIVRLLSVNILTSFSRFDLHSSAAYSSSKRFRREYVPLSTLDQSSSTVLSDT